MKLKSNVFDFRQTQRFHEDEWLSSIQDFTDERDRIKNVLMPSTTQRAKPLSLMKAIFNHVFRRFG